ncbi:Chitoporin [Vibrio crassostreae]|uniref:Chitoporin n=1 Tax=Vibrio crassostreae TaxID=246167 RepID=A0A4R3P4C4_9VIBR|nr:MULTISPECIES: porin [Vibrio]MDH5948625.1 porin [Vibrio crassostreae]PMI22514.1 porin [Vibrio sp. 10N.286.46.E10]PMI90335.1 porin [Vibrio sp. 10N.286.45.E10]PTP09355.1 porin [Vibrio sp. 10N.286.45.A3]PTQ04780.1 porin [Vibrio sp. ZF 223]
MENKIFKRTLLGASVALLSTGVMAKEVGINSDFNVDVYGVAAISLVNYNTTDNNDSSSGYAVENESRIGFRAHKDMFEDVTITMQIESGYVDSTDWSHGGVSGGVLGFRDTFVGASGSWGNLRVGRVLTPLYEIVDWPFSNPGLGSVFDWGGINGHYDRQSNQVRYDSAKFGGFSFAASVGRDDNDNGGGAATRDANFVGASAKYSFEKVTFMGAVESGTRVVAETGGEYVVAQEDIKDANGNVTTPKGEIYLTDTVAGYDDDTFAYIVGFEASLPAGFGIAAAYKGEELDNGIRKVTQDSYSIIGQYWNGPIGFKLGYAANLESETNGSKDANSDSNTISGQLMAVHNGFVPYLRVAGRTVGDADTDIVTRVGLEYGF